MALEAWTIYIGSWCECHTYITEIVVRVARVELDPFIMDHAFWTVILVSRLWLVRRL